MDLMAARRRLLAIGNGEKDYLSGAIWVENKYINDSGVIGSNYATHYTENQINATNGTYRLTGKNGSIAINYRIHTYNANDVWQECIIKKVVNANEEVDITFEVPNVNGIRISCANLFVGKLVKV